jgi:hypothetical protein
MTIADRFEERERQRLLERATVVEEYRRAFAEHKVLDTFDTLRSTIGHDYGGGQRRRSIASRWAVVERLAEEAFDLGTQVSKIAPPTRGELALAYVRVLQPMIKRARRDGERQVGPGAGQGARRIVRAAGETAVKLGLNVEDLNAARRKVSSR